MIALKEFIKELKKNINIQDVFVTQNDPISEVEIDIIAQEISYISLKNDFILFKSSNGLKINWSKKESDILFQSGECNISGGMDTFFSSGRDIYWGKEDLGNKKYDKFCQRLILFDKYDKTYDSSRNIAMEINKKKNKIKKLWYWNDEGDKYPLTLNLSNYLNNMVKTKSIVNWQLFFIDFESIQYKSKYYREWLYGLSHEDTLDEMRIALKTSSLFEKELFNFLKIRYNQTVKEFKKF